MFCLDVLKHLMDRNQQKLLEKWVSGLWILHHNGAQAHSFFYIMEFLIKHHIPFVDSKGF
jgi:hypothetical protein